MLVVITQESWSCIDFVNTVLTVHNSNIYIIDKWHILGSLGNILQHMIPINVLAEAVRTFVNKHFRGLSFKRH